MAGEQQPIKPCPCGDDRAMVIWNPTRTLRAYRVACAIAPCWEGPWAATNAAAIHAWNEREGS